MKFPYRTIGIVLKYHQTGIEDLVRKIVEWADPRNVRILCLEGEIWFPGVECVPKEKFQEESDLILVLGGDGTFLAAGRQAWMRSTPILGVNLGRLGFLTEITVEELFPTMDKIEAGEVSFDIRHLLQVRVKSREHVIFEGHAINDAVVAKGAMARLLELETRVNGNFLALFKADGLIISTPTGSTAYSLAAGGPIVFPTMEATIMTPICPHSLNHRPLVIPDHLGISIHLQAPAENVSLTLDGQVGRALKNDEFVEMMKSPHHLKVIRSPFKSYFDILKSKLRWAEI